MFPAVTHVLKISWPLFPRSFGWCANVGSTCPIGRLYPCPKWSDGGEGRLQVLQQKTGSRRLVVHGQDIQNFLAHTQNASLILFPSPSSQEICHCCKTSFRIRSCHVFRAPNCSFEVLPSQTKHRSSNCHNARPSSISTVPVFPHDQPSAVSFSQHRIALSRTDTPARKCWPGIPCPP